jgi:hypothetical protein
VAIAVLNNVTTQDSYVPDTELFCEGAVKLNVQVFNAAIYYSYRPRTRQHPIQSGSWSPEVILGPGVYLLARRAEAIRVRSAVTGKPAQVTIEAI